MQRSPMRPRLMKNIVTEDYPVAKDKLKQDLAGYLMRKYKDSAKKQRQEV